MLPNPPSSFVASLKAHILFARFYFGGGRAPIFFITCQTLHFPPPPAFQRPSTSPRTYLPSPVKPGALPALGPATYPEARSDPLSAYPRRSFHKPVLCLRPVRQSSHKARPAHKSSDRERRQRLCLALPSRPLHSLCRGRVST